MWHHFMKISSGIQMLLARDTHAYIQRHREQGGLISLLSLFGNKEIRIKKSGRNVAHTFSYRSFPKDNTYSCNQGDGLNKVKVKLSLYLTN
jgi:hypothetical protein